MLKKTIKLLLITLIFFLQLVSLTTFANNIYVYGVNSEIKEEILKNLAEYNKSTQDDALSESFIQDEVKNLLTIYGYYSPTIKISSKKSSGSGSDTVIKIKPGKAVIIQNITIQFSNNKNLDELSKETQELIKAYKQQKSQRINHITYNNFKENLLQSLRNHGYIDAQLTQHKIIIDETNYTADIVININLNSLYYIKTITVDIKSSKYNPNLNPEANNKFVFEFLPFDYQLISYNTASANNAPYNSQQILDLQNSLTYYFRENNIETDINSDNHTVNLKIKLTPVLNYFYSLGMGFSTDEGVRAFGSLQSRNISPRRHKLDIKTKVAQYKDLIETNYLLAGFRPATDIASIGYQFRSDKKRSDRNIEKERHQLIAQYKRALDSGKKNITLGTSYRNEKFIDFSKLSSTTSQLFVPFIIYDQVVTTNRIKTYQGHHINIRIDAANHGILSDTSFVRLHTKMKSIMPIRINKDITGLRVIAKGQFGQVWHKKQDMIPPTLRFFAGGSDTVRGYRFESIGPTKLNAKGKPVIVGADRLIAASLELEKTIYNNWSAAVFYDAGNATNKWGRWVRELHTGAGAGLRWQSPLGPIRFDVASALDKNGKPWRIDINIGPDL